MRLFKHLSAAKGFTLIELLVVIGILGILAAALIATIDPFEQLRKANDTSARNTALEFLNASTRYYGINNEYPWEANCGNSDGTIPVDTLLLGYDCIDILVSSGELKSTFASSENILKEIEAYQESPDDPLYVCFQPQSKQFRSDPNARYTIDTTGANESCAPGEDSDCLYCVQ